MSTENKSQWCLAFVVGEIQKDSTAPTTQINAIEPICLETFKADKKAISEYHRSLQLVKSVQLNIQQFLEAIVHYAAEFHDDGDMNEEKLDHISLNFSRLFLNILSMFRSLLDHSDLSISREFGKHSEKYELWKAAQSKQYDSLFEYRFFYKLRNYCQHVGMPPLHISFSSSAKQEGISFRLDISRDKLLEETSSWNQQLINDLQACQKHISVLDSLQNWGESFRAISKTLLEIKRKAALKSAQRILEHRARLNLPEDVGYLCAVRIPQSQEKPQSLNLQLDWFPENKAKEIVAGTPFDMEN